jgi:hypothetical protein
MSDLEELRQRREVAIQARSFLLTASRCRHPIRHQENGPISPLQEAVYAGFGRKAPRHLR